MNTRFFSGTSCISCITVHVCVCIKTSETREMLNNCISIVQIYSPQAHTNSEISTGFPFLLFPIATIILGNCRNQEKIWPLSNRIDTIPWLKYRIATTLLLYFASFLHRIRTRISPPTLSNKYSGVQHCIMHSPLHGAHERRSLPYTLT